MQALNNTATENLQHINEHRAAIDELDTKIIQLLNERAQHSLAIRTLKPGANMELFDPAREQEIIRKLAASNNGPLEDKELISIYKTVLKVMKETSLKDI